MQIRDLIPWGRHKGDVQSKGALAGLPFGSLQQDVNRVFDDFWNRFDRPFLGPNGFLAAGPRTDISETDGEVEVSVELPGLNEKDIEVNLTDDTLTIRGEKKVEKEEKKRNYYRSERSYGAFHRTIPLPPGVDSDKAEAKFKNGVLSITVPKTAEAKAKVKRIEVKSG